MTRLFLLIIFLVAGQIQAQHLLLTQPDSLPGFFSRNKVILSIGGGISQQSNAITNSFVNKIINGGFIDDELKDRQPLSNSENLFNAAIHADVNVRIAPDSLFGTDRYGLILGVSHYDDLSTRFTSDVFNTVFHGNKMYAGKSASLSNTGIRFQQFQQLNIGFFEKKSLSHITVGLIHGNYFADLTLADSKMYTEATGDFIEFSADGRFHLSDTSNMQGFVTNGLGAALSFELNLPIRFANRPQQPSYIRIGAHNVGFISWNKQTINYRLDTTYHYDGFLIDDLTNVEDWNVEQVVDSLVPDATHESYLMTTPGWFYLSWFSPLGRKFFYEVSLKTKVYSFHLPEAGAELFYNPGSKFLLGVNATYGGYGGYESASAFRAGLSLSTLIGKRFMLDLESRHLVGWLNEDGFGRNVFIKLGILL